MNKNTPIIHDRDEPGEIKTDICCFDVLTAVDKKNTQIPSVIKLSPRGKFTTRDGRALNIQPETLVQRFDNDEIDVAIDVDHATARYFNDGISPAVGWIHKLEARDDGLYGYVEFLEEGLKILKDRTHRYISPTLTIDDLGKAQWLHSAALVATPAISMPNLSKSHPSKLNLQPEQKEPQHMFKSVFEKLGLSDKASEVECLTALSALIDNKIDKSVHDKTLETLKATQNEPAGLTAETHQKNIDVLIEGAFFRFKMRWRLRRFSWLRTKQIPINRR